MVLATCIHNVLSLLQILQKLFLSGLGNRKIIAGALSFDTGVGLVPARPVNRRGSGSIKRRKKGGSDAGSPRKRGRKVDEEHAVHSCMFLDCIV